MSVGHLVLFARRQPRSFTQHDDITSHGGSRPLNRWGPAANSFYTQKVTLDTTTTSHSKICFSEDL